MEEYVSLDKQIEINDVNGRTLNTTVRHILDINHARYDVLPVVRCKDCRFPYGHGLPTKFACRYACRYVDENDYCSYGEPKEEEHE